MKSKITQKQLDQLEMNQKLFQHTPPVTTRATFKLSELEKLIGEIRAVVGEVIQDENHTHHVCITFVREKIGDNTLGYHISRPGHKLLLENVAITESGKEYTQLIPIITGCIAELDKDYNYKPFKYLQNKDKTIEFVRPGGEGMGVIPPPRS